MKPKRASVVGYPRAEIAAVEKFIQEHDGKFTKRALSEHLSTMIARETVDEIIGFLLYSHKVHVDRRGNVNWIFDSPQAIKGSQPRTKKRWSKMEEANAITCFAFLNGFLEELHAGKYSDLLEDSDLSRITDPEMKKLMIEASQKVAELLSLKEKEPEKYWRLITWFNESYCKKWER